LDKGAAAGAGWAAAAAEPAAFGRGGKLSVLIDTSGEGQDSAVGRGEDIVTPGLRRGYRYFWPMEHRSSARVLTAARSGFVIGSLGDEVGDFDRVRNQGSVAGGHRNAGRSHALSDKSLQFGIDEAVIGRDNEPGRLRFPGRGTYRYAKAVLFRDGLLDDGHDVRLREVDVVCEGFVELLAGNPEEAVLVEANGRKPGGRGKTLDQIIVRLALIRAVGGDVDHPGNVRRLAGFRDDKTRVGMADKKGGAVLLREEATSRSDVVVE